MDSLSYKDVFRRVAKHNLLTIDLVERWLTYRDNRNNTAHDYGVSFANDTLTLLPAFIEDVSLIITRLNQKFGDDDRS